MAFGFTATKKWQLLKKTSNDKRLTFEIYFHTSRKNFSGHVSLCPYISVYSEQLKVWQKEKYNSDYGNGIIFSVRLERLTPIKQNDNWNIALSNQDNILPRVIDLIKVYALPVFEKFENIDQIITEISQNGLKLNEYFDTRYRNLPIDFLCFFGNQYIAQNAFDNYLKQQKLLANAKRVFEELKTNGHLSLYKHTTDRTMLEAYFNNLKING